jgi:hypothetical protein
MIIIQINVDFDVIVQMFGCFFKVVVLEHGQIR